MKRFEKIAPNELGDGLLTAEKIEERKGVLQKLSDATGIPIENVKVNSAGLV